MFQTRIESPAHYAGARQLADHTWAAATVPEALVVLQSTL